MASEAKPYVFRVTHEFVVDAESVERGHRVWAMYLAEQLRKKVLPPVATSCRTGSEG